MSEDKTIQHGIDIEVPECVERKLREGKIDDAEAFERGLGSIDKIVLSTRQGDCIVELMCGDITRLPIEDKVDYILISAFPNDYSAVRGTVIGSLYSYLGIDVERLAVNKDVDLRKNFSCWVSGALPSHAPYKRLVCFERIYQGGSVSEQIAKVYRSFTPIFNNEETTVISPLLATGNQGHSTKKILTAMVDGACGWILSGLPLRHLKLVVYSKKINEIYKRDVETVEEFKNLKIKWEKISKSKAAKAEQIDDYDVYLSYSEADIQSSQKIISKLQRVKPEIKLFTKIITFSNNDVWQQKIFDVMVKSKRIIVILSPAYIANEECLEQFNMAMCCNRYKKKQVLAPFYIETIPSFPSYMLLVQYVECRIRRESDNDERLIGKACEIIIEAIEEDTVEVLSVKKTPHYDVFISYAHRTPLEAESMLGLLQTNSPWLNIFFDKRELCTGSVWQKSLYESIDNASVIVMFISDAYINSTVCSEEYDIALARYYLKDDVVVVPLYCGVKDDKIPAKFSAIPMIDIQQDKDNKLQQLVEYIKHCDVDKTGSVLYSEPTNEANVQDILENKRTDIINSLHKFDKDKVNLKLKTALVENQKIVFSFSQNCLKYAAAICQYIEKTNETLECIFLSENHNERLSLLDKADRIVIIISKQYIESNNLMEEFHIAMCRQRAFLTQNIVYLINASHSQTKPVFMSIVPYSISLKDKVWIREVKYHSDKSTSIIIKRIGIAGSYNYHFAEIVALQTAALDLSYGLVTIKDWKNMINIISIDQNKTHDKLVQKCFRTNIFPKEDRGSTTGGDKNRFEEGVTGKEKDDSEEGAIGMESQSGSNEKKNKNERKKAKPSGKGGSQSCVLI
ncbi:hypothetical protein LOTGIDRAFT_234910 [Lottia gigantea]|uniref:TIR domain-containing protein n=1 Tax=Lottia gigantea TaxID=225164 RepID=V4A2X4_LOTGI|nr:hypothetical protein LOTGIDRAFT_234910 [Lottia gigantea]ESO87656.1 hypothetical protein LOTGIDRAFT_234910 [Lottia gigantea]